MNISETLKKLGFSQNAAVPTSSTADLRRDMAAGQEMGREIVGTGLGRLSTDPEVAASRQALSRSVNMSDAEKRMKRDAATVNLQGSEQAQERQLTASLARSGVKGGAAGQAHLELAASNLSNRRAMERDLTLDQMEFSRRGAAQLAEFDTQIAQFDLAQAAKEKNIELQSGLAFAGMGSNERAAIRSEQTAEKIAKTQANASGGKK